MTRYRKKPVEIEAMQYLPPGNCAEVHAFVGYEHTVEECGPDADFDIDTLEGTMTARPGDWIIRGIRGEFYPCNPDIFAATYEAVES